MWVLKLKIMHDCTIANRCKKYNCSAYSLPLGKWRKGNYSYTSERHTIQGDPRATRSFIEDIKKDKRIIDLEISGNTLFFIAKDKGERPSSFYSHKIFFTKPVFVDKSGFEYWETASYEREILSGFAESLKKRNYEHFEITCFKNTKLDNIYFPAVSPDLTEKQKHAFDLALEEGYYDIPKRTELKKLARMMGVSLATYQEHLKRAEAKIIKPLYKMATL